MATAMHYSLFAAETGKFTSQDIFDLEYVSEVRIARDGKRVAYVRSSHDIMTDGKRNNLWLYDLNTDSHYPLLADQHNYSQPRWSPDGNHLAYLSNRSGRQQLHLYWLFEDKHAVLTQVNESIGDITWSPDGQWLAFTMQVPQEKSEFARGVKKPVKPEGAKWAEEPIIIDKVRYQADGSGILEPAFKHVFVLPVSGGTPRQLTQGEFQHQGPLTWRPDNQAVLFSSNFAPDWEYQVAESDLYQVSVATGEVSQISKLPGRESDPQFSSDGRQLAFLSTGPEPVPYQNARLYQMDWQTKQLENLTPELDRSVEAFAWQDNNSWVIQYDERGKRLLARLTEKGKLTSLTDSLSGTTLGRPYVSGSFDLAGDGTLVFTHGNSQRPADMALWRKGKTRQLTRLNEDLLGHKQLGQVHEITYASSFDGEPIHGWYITPPDFDPVKKYPLLLEIHGGPHLAYGPHFSAELQRYAAEGYVVFYDNHRGSTSYGERFALLLDGKYSSKEDFADHDSGVDAMIAKGFIDPNNLFIAGGSAGGIAAAYAIGLTNRFNAAAITKPVINWVSKVLTADSSLGQISHQFPGMPWEHLDHYWQRSPLSLVGNVTTPAMIMTGEADRRTPISESEQYYQALKLRKVDSMLVRVPGAPHGIAGKPSRMIAKIEHTLAWFERYRR
nr:S9 family peptidase [Bowmanella dokdonensis]